MAAQNELGCCWLTVFLHLFLVHCQNGLLWIGSSATLCKILDTLSKTPVRPSRSLDAVRLRSIAFAEQHKLSPEFVYRSCFLLKPSWTGYQNDLHFGNIWWKANYSNSQSLQKKLISENILTHCIWLIAWCAQTSKDLKVCRSPKVCNSC